MSKLPSWRKPNPHRPVGGPNSDPNDLKRVPATRFFDNLSFIGNESVGCFLIETSEGLIMLDSMEPQFFPEVEQGIKDLGYDPHDLKHILVTHGHFDHWGTSGYFQEKYGTKVHLSQVDIDFAYDANHPKKAFPGYPVPYFKFDEPIEGGDVFVLGDTEVEIYSTPGHTPGGLSFIFKVYDEGREHLCSLWGGTGLRRTMEENVQLLESCEEFARIGIEKGVDVAISTHPFVDNTVERLAVVRNIVDGVPNPFVLGYEGYHRFEMMYINMYRKWIEDHKDADLKAAEAQWNEKFGLKR